MNSGILFKSMFGLRIIGRRKVEMVNRVIWMVCRNIFGKSLFMYLIFFEKWFKMLMVEFVLKNKIGVWRIEIIIFWWRCLDECKVVVKKNEVCMIDSMNILFIIVV